MKQGLAVVVFCGVLWPALAPASAATVVLTFTGVVKDYLTIDEDIPDFGTATYNDTVDYSLAGTPVSVSFTYDSTLISTFVNTTNPPFSTDESVDQLIGATLTLGAGPAIDLDPLSSGNVDLDLPEGLAPGLSAGSIVGYVPNGLSSSFSQGLNADFTTGPGGAAFPSDLVTDGTYATDVFGNGSYYTDYNTVVTGSVFDEDSHVTGNDLQFNFTSFEIQSDAVPEPATWAMMLLGFGAIGGALRGARRSRAVTV